MPKILLGISILLMAATAFLGFNNKTKFTKLGDEKKTAQEQAQLANQEKSKAEADKKKSDELAAQAKTDAETATAGMKQAQDEAQRAKSQLDAANTDVASLKEQIAKLQASPGTTTSGGPDAETASKISDLTTKLAEADTKAKEAETLVASLQNRLSESEKTSAALKDAEQRRQQNLARPGLEGQVMAVNQSWNFVVLNIGDKQGVVPNASMVVMRGQERVANVKITSVEPGTAIADIIPGSTAKGTRVLPGDKVIYPGS